MIQSHLGRIRALLQTMATIRQTPQRLWQMSLPLLPTSTMFQSLLLLPRRRLPFLRLQTAHLLQRNRAHQTFLRHHKTRSLQWLQTLRLPPTTGLYFLWNHLLHPVSHPHLLEESHIIQSVDQFLMHQSQALPRAHPQAAQLPAPALPQLVTMTLIRQAHRLQT